LIELEMMARPLLKDDDGDVDGAEDTEFIGLFEKTILALKKGDCAVALVLERSEG
jgi:hypothetical protein